jgi:hypothetical protein
MLEKKYYNEGLKNDPIQVDSSDSEELELVSNTKPNFLKAANKLSKKLSSQIISESLESINKKVYSNIS